MCALRRCRSFAFESLECRTLMAADLLNGMLTIVGTKGNDNIHVQVAASGAHAGELQVDVNSDQNFFDVNLVNSIQISGLAGKDQITVDDAVLIDSVLDGGVGKDVLRGGGGNDTIHGGAGNDAIDGSLGNDTIFGGQGNDSIHGGDGDDIVHGNEGDDAIWGGTGNDSLWGDVGMDTIDGELGDDDCHGGNGIDFVHGGAGIDEVYGDKSNDRVWGDDDNDYVDGGNGMDILRGGLGDDELRGGRGDDKLDGDQGDNLLDGGLGHDGLANGIQANLDNEFRSLFTGTNGESGSAKYDAKNHSNVVETRLEIDIEDFAPNATLDVEVDNVLIGQINTDGSGDGELKFSTSPSGNELAFPAGFPTLHSGSTILIANSVQGTFVPWHNV